SLASLAFDISLFEWLYPLLHGGQVRLVCKEDILDMAQLQHHISQADWVHMVPSLLGSWLNSLHAEACTQLTGLKGIATGGDNVPASLLKAVHHTLPEVALLQFYGPTEATLIASCETDAAQHNHSIGQVISHSEAYVLDQDLQLQPQGCVGELYLGGALAQGYLNQPKLSAHHFIAHPFKQDEGARLYKTGDLVRVGKDGRLSFVGRSDEQVKIRGFRVELGDIEQHLRALSGVTDCVVMVQTEDTEKRLVAYVQSTEDTEQSALIAKWRAGLSQQLPSYMVPTGWCVLAALPLNVNGKLDKKALPEIDMTQAQAEYVAPQNEQERALVEIWATLLKLEADKLSVLANFFELGGDSILSIQVVSRAAQQGL
ncbi:non-ribosomal peptide synthetase, partial [Pseudoalteromonas umbrosa]|uniref:non-ribosomal peptide synthetase n=1 Tax=Pseudoalteromonas umbrosa TaxID=3048489 RepID=UPI0024C4709E